MRLFSLKCFVLVIALSLTSFILADNQTPDISPIFPGQDLPFRVRIKLLKEKKGNLFLLPNGLQSYNLGVYEGKWLLINGRTNGLHGFNDDSNNFPPQSQNRTLYVIDPEQRTVVFRSLVISESGLTQDQIDSLSVTSAQSYQSGRTLYITGGYGFRTSINDFTTFDILTAIDIPGLIHWVTHPGKKGTAAEHIRQITDPVFKVTGGKMFQLGKKNPTLLVFGQDFEGAYFSDESVQIYTKQVRRFKIRDDGSHLSVKILSSTPQDENFRRRDLNVVPIIRQHSHGNFRYGLAALSGVFTLSGGAWTVPVTITAHGEPSMADPANPTTFKQGMNNYDSAFLSLYSRKSKDMYTVILGGITFEYFQDGVLEQDPELPFTNQVAAIKLDKYGNFSQYIMEGEYPAIFSTQSNPGNRLLFGSDAVFIPANGLEKFQYKQAIFKLDLMKGPLVIGYIVGGIQSTLMNTNTMSDSAASPYIFKVILEPNFKSSSSFID